MDCLNSMDASHATSFATTHSIMNYHAQSQEPFQQSFGINNNYNNYNDNNSMAPTFFNIDHDGDTFISQRYFNINNMSPNFTATLSDDLISCTESRHFFL